jgi:hypothetical protein
MTFSVTTTHVPKSAGGSLVGSGIGYGTTVGMVMACRDMGLCMDGWD